MEGQVRMNAETLPVLTLAYVGDAVFELEVRRRLLASGIVKTNLLHDAAVKLVSAESQSRFWQKLEPFLTEKEIAVFKRGRNCKAPHPRNNAPIQDYRRASGLEALVGWLFLAEEGERLEKIFDLLFE